LLIKSEEVPLYLFLYPKSLPPNIYEVDPENMEEALYSFNELRYESF